MVTLDIYIKEYFLASRWRNHQMDHAREGGVQPDPDCITLAAPGQGLPLAGSARAVALEGWGVSDEESSG